MTPLPWYMGGLALAGIALTHRIAVGKSLAVSGRFSALVDRVRHGAVETDSMSDGELVKALQAATAAEFGTLSPEAVAAPEAAAEEVAAPQAATEEPTARDAPLPKDIAFLVGLFLGGLLFALAAQTFHAAFELRSTGLAALSHSLHVPTPLLLLFGGILVGFGTRMAGGCTSGHGLCGVSRLQRGSFLTTAAFFGTGVVVSYLIEAIS